MALHYTMLSAVLMLTTHVAAQTTSFDRSLYSSSPPVYPSRKLSSVIHHPFSRLVQDAVFLANVYMGTGVHADTVYSKRHWLWMGCRLRTSIRLRE
jgi:hypothetical protein